MSELTMADSALLSKIFSRTPSGAEIQPGAWQDVMRDISNFAKSCNALMTVSGDIGSGKTTFLKILQDKLSSDLDVIHVSPASTSAKSGWILDAIAPWISSETSNTHGLFNRLKGLSETSRPILICVDGADFIQEGHIAGDISALLNLADASDIRLSILICSGAELAGSLASDNRTSSRLMYQNNLPSLTQTETTDFIQARIRLIREGQQNLSIHQFEKIFQDSGGIPGRILRHLAHAFGHKTDLKPKSKNQHTPSKIVKGSDTANDQSIKPKLDDLLAPPKDQ